MKINKDEIVYLQKRQRDNIGEIFEWKGRIFRGIFREKTEMVKGFFSSGFIASLIQEDLFPMSWISEHESEGYGLLIEHKRIQPIIYPQEWSFSMLRDGALAALRVAMIARQYGYNMKDCHGLNILFENNKPKFVDLGSFHPNRSGCTGWEPYQEFLRFYYYPLYMWGHGLAFVSKLSIFSGNLMPHFEHYIYKYKLLRYLGPQVTDCFLRIKFLASNLACLDPAGLSEKYNARPFFLRFVKIVKHIVDRLRLSKSQDLNKLRTRILRVRKKPLPSRWKKYHLEIEVKKQRFDKIIAYVNECCPEARTAVDMGGNQGLFAEKLLKQTRIQQVICQDADEQAIDLGYQKNRNNGSIIFLNYNIIAPTVKTTYLCPEERFRSDIVFSLALLHHLILSQGFDLRMILREISKYTRQYVCIEFMPKGLWIRGAKTAVPSWYTVEWFKKEFESFFQVLKEDQVDENYIMFIGRLKS